jgi:hypothetical protein
MRVLCVGCALWGGFFRRRSFFRASWPRVGSGQVGVLGLVGDECVVFGVRNGADAGESVGGDSRRMGFGTGCDIEVCSFALYLGIWGGG